MAKRPGELSTNNSKKQKLNDLNDTFWDDDVDENCFDEIANKILDQDVRTNENHSQSQGNVSILPSYDSFRPNIPFASTQNNPVSAFIKPPDIGGVKEKELHEELKVNISFLQQKCEAKEGEVTILRTQMQKLKSEMREDQSRKQKEYLENTNLKDKEIKCIKGQLEFKNLEIANLKQKISEISKANINVTNHHENIKRPRNESSSKSLMAPAPYDNPRRLFKYKETRIEIETYILQGAEFPLLSKFPTDFFETSMPEVLVVETRSNQYGKNTIPYLHNQMMQEECTVPSGPKVTVKINEKDVGLEYIYPEMLKIIQSDVEDINSEENNLILNKILFMSIQLLEYFKQYLELLEKLYRTEDIEQMDKTFLQNVQSNCDSSEKTYNWNCEIGVRAGKTVQFVAEVLPFSTYLLDYIVLGKSVKFNVDSGNSSCLGHAGKKDFYLSLLNDIVKKIFYLRKTEVCHSFLNAVATLLLNVTKDGMYDKMYAVLNALIGSLLFTRPPTDVLHKLLVVMKNYSKSRYLVDFLCRKPDSKNFTIDKKRKLHYFMDESCKFTLFVAQLNNRLHGIRDEKVSLDVAVNILSFTYNIFMMNPSWMHDQQKDQCICLEQLYQLAVEVVYRTLLSFRSNTYTPCKEKYVSIFKCGIKVFEVLTFNSYDLMEKYVENYSRYREICSSLLELKDELNLIEEIKDLEKLSLFEEVPNVSSAKFDLL